MVKRIIPKCMHGIFPRSYIYMKLLNFKDAWQMDSWREEWSLSDDSIHCFWRTFKLEQKSPSFDDFDTCILYSLEGGPVSGPFKASISNSY